MKPWSWFLACGVITTLALGSYFLDLPQGWKSAHPGADHEIVVRLVQARRVSLPQRIEISGKLHPERIFNLVSRLGGKVTEVRVNVGDFVKAGALIATVQADGLEQRIREQESGVDTAREELQTRETEQTEAEQRVADRGELLRRGLISRSDFEEVKNSAETSRAQFELARANLAQQEATLTQLIGLRALTRLVAPVNGQVSSISVKPGSLVGEQGAIMTLVDPERLKLIETVSEDRAEMVRSGNLAEISKPESSGVIAPAKVTRVEPLPGGATSSYAIEIGLADKRRIFRPGMTVDAWIVLDARDELLLIPRAAIAAENKRPWVFKVDGGRALLQEVTLGREIDDRVEITEGLTDRDWVIVDSPKNLHSGSRIRAGNSSGQ
jgi:RND family efflux transporter MFP subunit